MKLRLYTLLALLCLSVLTVRPVAADSASGLSFFRVIDDKKIYSKTPAKYERVISKDSTGEYETYIDRQSAHVIPEAAIESVIVRKTKTYGGSPKKGAFYDATFKIGPREGKRFSIFTEKNQQGRFQLRLGKRNLGVVQLGAGRFEADEKKGLEFTVYLSENESTQLKEIFRPLRDKVTWE